MGQRHRVWRVLGVAEVMACAALVAAGCGGSGEESSAATTEAPPTTEPLTTTTTLDPQAQALADAEAAYLAYEEAYLVAAADPVNPQLPELQALITGDQRIHLNGKLGGDLAAGKALRLAQPSQFGNEVLAVTTQPDGSVLLKVCQVDDRVVYNVASGAVIDDDAVTKTVDNVMVNDGGAWKVSLSTIVERAEGITSCAA